MGDSLEYIFPWTGGTEGIIRALKVAAAVMTGNPYLIVAAYAQAGMETYASQNMPGPESGKFTRRQAQPTRQYGVGQCRVSGPFALQEAKDTIFHQIIALPEGPVDHFGRYWLHDDEVTINVAFGGTVNATEDGRYRWGNLGDVVNPLVKIQTRKGLVTETAYSEAVTALPGIWTTSHRGDGVPSLYLRARSGGLEGFSQRYPNGKPEPSVEAFYAAYDWRDEAQDRNDPATWTHTGNLVVWAVNVMWRRCGHDWDAEIEPTLALLSAEADIADEAVPLKAGGTEPRYWGGFFFDATNSEAAVLGTIASAMDGWIGKDRNGSIIVRCGHFYEPTVVFGDEEVVSYSFDPGPTPDQRVTQLAVSYTSPAHQYSQVEVDPWGPDLTRIEPFYPEAAQSNGLARRLAKRKFAKVNAATGTIRTGLAGRRGAGERYIGLNISENEDLANVVVEIVGYEMDLMNASILWSFMLADPDIDDWNPEEEEGELPPEEEPVDPDILFDPTISDVEVFYDVTGLPRLRVTAGGPNRDDLAWRIGYRAVGDVAFIESTALDIDPLTPVLLESGLVPQGELEVIVGYQTAAGTVIWMDEADAYSVDTTPGAAVPDAPSIYSVEGNPGLIDVSWGNPSAAFHGSRVWRGAAGDPFNLANDESGLRVSGPGTPDSYTMSSLAPGDYSIWVTAENTDGDLSIPAGPVTVTVT